MLGTITAEELPARELAVGDVLVLGHGEYPIRGIERAEADLLRLRLASVRLGWVQEDFGGISIETWRTARRVAR